jgi:hypothetical protein
MNDFEDLDLEDAIHGWNADDPDCEPDEWEYLDESLEDEPC